MHKLINDYKVGKADRKPTSYSTFINHWDTFYQEILKMSYIIEIVTGERFEMYRYKIHLKNTS